ncbi:uncharacterized protein LOC120190223 [Hibiscus syriacus]|uniref:uncharacterized protein LOC120190223 n=1 Tax=Hibiscus syriacus TaxID=106335 RepID=UPI0019234876|nr:uncharacterized protein LOC120190223 [Hibiscus syriacus]
MSALSMTTTSGEWDWELLKATIPEHICHRIAAICPPNLTLGKDTPGWNWEFWSLEGGLEHKNTTRIRTFLWLALHGKLLTNGERYRRHLASSATCSLCQNDDEDMDHVLRKCPSAFAIWRRVVDANELLEFMEFSNEGWLVVNPNYVEHEDILVQSVRPINEIMANMESGLSGRVVHLLLKGGNDLLRTGLRRTSTVLLEDR